MNEINSNNLDLKSKNVSSLKRVGNFIKEARLSRNLSTAELASNLKIGEHQLKAIEDGREDLLPEIVFIKAMVRRISEKLKIDTDFIMSEFKNERKDVVIEDVVQEVSKKIDTKKQAINYKSMGFTIFILISGIFGLLSSSLILNFFSNSFNNKNPNQEFIKKN